MIKRTIAAAVAASMIFSVISVRAEAAEASLSHESGFFSGTQYVTIINSAGSEVYYTTDGSNPEKGGSLYTGAPIIVSENTVIRMAAYSGGILTSTDKASIKIRTSTPHASVKSGTYYEAQKIKLSCIEPDADIYYTTDGTVPTKKSTKYSKAISVNETTTIRFAAFAPDKSRSKVVTVKCTIAENEFSSPECQQLFELVNQTRAEYGLKPLKPLAKLTEAAEIRAKEYAVTLGHIRPDGSRWDTLLAEYGLKRNTRAENLAYYYNSAKGAMNCWLSDPYHRGNILDPEAEYIGLGYYNNGWCSYWCQLFIGEE